MDGVSPSAARLLDRAPFIGGVYVSYAPRRAHHRTLRPSLDRTPAPPQNGSASASDREADPTRPALVPGQASPGTLGKAPDGPDAHRLHRRWPAVALILPVRRRSRRRIETAGITLSSSLLPGERFLTPRHFSTRWSVFRSDGHRCNKRWARQEERR